MGKIIIKKDGTIEGHVSEHVRAQVEAIAEHVKKYGVTNVIKRTSETNESDGNGDTERPSGG